MSCPDEGNYEAHTVLLQNEFISLMDFIVFNCLHADIVLRQFHGVLNVLFFCGVLCGHGLQ